jgi:hypothetical protein
MGWLNQLAEINHTSAQVAPDTITRPFVRRFLSASRITKVKLELITTATIDK